MGYRHYFYLVEKKDVEQIKNLTIDELRSKKRKDEEDDYISFSEDVINKEEIFEFGKLYWCDTANRIYSKGEPLFTNKETMEYFDDYLPYIVGKDGLIEAIHCIQNKAVDYLAGLLKEPTEDDKRTVEQKCVESVKSKLDYIYPFERVMLERFNGDLDEDISEDRKQEIMSKPFKMVDLDEEKKYRLTGTWLYEYEVFELVHILKSVDWNKYTILFYGW